MVVYTGCNFLPQHAAGRHRLQQDTTGCQAPKPPDHRDPCQIRCQPCKRIVNPPLARQPASRTGARQRHSTRGAPLAQTPAHTRRIGRLLGKGGPVSPGRTRRSAYRWRACAQTQRGGGRGGRKEKEGGRMRKKEEGRRPQKEEGRRRKKEEGRTKKEEEGRRKKEKGRRKKER